MTVAEVIEQYNTERPNHIEDATKILWLKKCEHIILSDVVHLYDEANNYLQDFDVDSELLVPEPYDDIYLHYLDQRIASANNDTRRYNVAIAAYNNALLSYQQFYRRTNDPGRPNKHLLRHEVL